MSHLPPPSFRVPFHTNAVGLFLFICSLTTLTVGACIAGIYYTQTKAWPYAPLASIKQALSHSPIRTDPYGRLTHYPGKTQITCPKQDAQTAVLLIFGQSNSSNNQGQRYKAIDNRVINFFDGKCYVAESPLLGSEGEYGESWTLLGNKLIESGIYKEVILVPTGVGNTEIKKWAAGGELNKVLLSTIDNVKPFYKITDILWHQGERDYALQTTEQEYLDRFTSIVSSIHNKGLDAPIFVSVASRELRDWHWKHDNPITLAQEKLPDGKSIFAGPDTDALVTPADRFDGTHFSASGQEKFARRWVELLEQPHIVHAETKP